MNKNLVQLTDNAIAKISSLVQEEDNADDLMLRIFISYWPFPFLLFLN